MMKPTEQTIKSRVFSRSYRTLLSVIILALTVLVMMVTANRTSERHHQAMLYTDASMDIQIDVSTFHLWFEEYLAGDKSVDLDKTLALLGNAVHLTGILLNGGETMHGRLTDPLRNRHLRDDAKKIKEHILELQEVTAKRLENMGEAGIGSALDQRFDAIFTHILDELRLFEFKLIEQESRSVYRNQLILLSVFSVWIIIIIIAIVVIDISNRHRRSAEKSAAGYLGVAGVMFVAIDSNGTVTLINKKGCEILGYEYGEIIGRNWFENFLPERVRGEVASVADGLLKGDLEAVEYFENSVLTRSGEERIVAWHNTVLRDNKGNTTGLLSSGEDITERKNTQRALKESEEKFRSIFESSNDAIMLLDEKGILIDCNDTAVKMFGCSSKNNFLEHQLCDWFPPSQPDGRDSLVAAEEKVAAAYREGVNSFEWVHRRANGEDFYTDVLLTPMRLDGRRVIQGTVRDINERKQVEKERNLLSIMTEQISNSVITTDLDFKITYTNKAFQDLYGYSTREIIGKSPEIFNAEPDSGHIQQEIYEKVTGGEVWSGELLNRKKDGSKFYIDATVYPLLDKQGETIAYTGIQQDITERKQAEKQISQETEVTKNLLRLSEATTNTADLDEFMRNVVNITSKITNTTVVMLYLWDSGTGTFRPCTAVGLAGDLLLLFRTTPVSLDVTSIKHAMDTGRVFTESSKTDSEPLKLQQGGLSDWIDNAKLISVLPLVGKREYLGFIACVCLNDQVYRCSCLSDKGKELMQAVANQVSIALEEALHYKESVSRAMELSQKVETIQTMSEISKSILSTLDVGEIFELTARMVSRLVPSDWVRIIEVDSVKEEFLFKVGFENGGVLESKVVPFTCTSLVEVVDTKRPEYIADLRKVDSPLDIERELAERGYLSVLRIPITVKGSVTGVLGLMSRRKSAFNPDDLSTLEKLSSQVGVALENARLVTDLEEFSVGAVKALAKTIDAKSPWTRGHSERVTEIALKIGREVGFSEEELSEFRIAGLLHDIGKIAVNELILDKPGGLTDEEYGQMKRHPAKGAEILTPIKQLTHILPIIRGHHEFYDGSGYPDGLKGREIPLQSRILTVADTVDAMGADRPYRKGMSRNKIVAELKRCSGTQFDTEIVEAYLRIIDKEDGDPST